MADDAKRIVLARRASFVAAAVASAGLIHCDACKPPRPCLSVVYTPPEGGVPQPCLSVLPYPEDAATAAATEAGIEDGGRDSGNDGGKGRAPGDATKRPDGGAPKVCLSF